MIATVLQADRFDTLTRVTDAPSASRHWLNVVSHLDPKYGGLSAIVPQLCAAIDADVSTSVELAAFCRPQEDYQPQSYSASSTTYWPAGRLKWLGNKTLDLQFREMVNHTDGVHIHGIWEHSTNLAAQVARSLGKPYIISAHGMLESWALANKRWKKRIYAAVLERTNVRGAACLHALTRAEAQDYRQFGAKGPIAIIPNAVSVSKSMNSDLFLASFPVLRGRRIILFLGRIHFKKGLDILVKSWAAIANKWPDACLVLAGPDSENTQGAVEQLISNYGIANQVIFTGMLDQSLKWSALAAAECFVLPSYSEGLSTSVLEAMGVGLPVIVTRQCNIPDVLEYDTGWQIESNVEELTSALTQFLENSPATNQNIGERGRRLVEQRYNWPSVASPKDRRRRISMVVRQPQAGNLLNF